MLEEIIQNPKKVMAYNNSSIMKAIASCQDAKTVKEFSRLKGISRSMKSAARDRWNEICWNRSSLSNEELDAWSPGGLTRQERDGYK